MGTRRTGGEIVGSAHESPFSSTACDELSAKSQKLHLRNRVFVANPGWA
jgi:hypothetical protein